MIFIVFPGGAFGSMVEYSIRQFSNELTKINLDIDFKNPIADNGSLHTFTKVNHPMYHHQLDALDHNEETASLVYPNHSPSSPIQSLELIKKHITDTDKVVLIWLPNLNSIERNFLFADHKAVPFKEMIYKHINHISDKKVNDMQIWELRTAWYTLIKEWAREFSIVEKTNNYISITSDELLFDTRNLIKNTISQLGLTLNETGFDEFFNEWIPKQEIIINRQKTLVDIVSNTIAKVDFSWEPIGIVMEALIQHRLEICGFKLNYENLNEFPTNSLKLAEIIESI
jgi:hypothetical protein